MDLAGSGEFLDAAEGGYLEAAQGDCIFLVAGTAHRLYDHEADAVRALLAAAGILANHEVKS